MKNINSIQIDYVTLRRFSFVFCIAILLLMVIPELSYAAADGVLPSSEQFDVPGADANSSFSKRFGYIIRLVVFLLCMSAVGLGISDSIFSLFRTINDARQSGEWGPAMKTIGIIIAGIIFALILFGILNEVVFSAIEKFFT